MYAVEGDYLTRRLDVETIVYLALASYKHVLYTTKGIVETSLNLAADSNLIGDVVKALYYGL
jgi:hypothetical protein